VDKVEEVVIKGPWFSHVVNLENHVRRDPCGLYGREINSVNDCRRKLVANCPSYSRSSSRRRNPLSIAQMPVPVPTSSICCGEVSLVTHSSPPRHRPNMWCWRSNRFCSDSSFGKSYRCRFDAGFEGGGAHVLAGSVGVIGVAVLKGVIENGGADGGGVGLDALIVRLRVE
jgi:hypothetical protein